MPTVPPQEIPKESAFANFDDFEAYQRTLEKTMNRAQELIDTDLSTLDPAQKKKLELELPRITASLRQLLRAQMEHNSILAEIDRADGSYDNATLDNQLRQQLGQLRDKSIDLNKMWGTRTVRKISAWITEDLPNWFNVKTSQAIDTLKQFLKGAAVVGGLTTATVIGGYAIANGGILPGLSILGEHLNVVGAYLGPKLASAGDILGTGAASVSTSLAALWNRILGKAPKP